MRQNEFPELYRRSSAQSGYLQKIVLIHSRYNYTLICVLFAVEDENDLLQ